MLPIHLTDHLRLASPMIHWTLTCTNLSSWLPESPRYLISKDRDEEAFDILVKYHAEGDKDSVFVQAEMTEIKMTIRLELEISKQTWFHMLKTAGMRRRVFIASSNHPISLSPILASFHFRPLGALNQVSSLPQRWGSYLKHVLTSREVMGLFTQWSGNTLISYYLSTILGMIGYDTTYAKTRINSMSHSNVNERSNDWSTTSGKSMLVSHNLWCCCINSNPLPSPADVLALHNIHASHVHWLDNIHAESPLSDRNTYNEPFCRYRSPILHLRLLALLQHWKQCFNL